MERDRRRRGERCAVGFGVLGLGFRVQGLGFRVQGLGFSVSLVSGAR